jgi:hypothetical protein
MTEPRRHSTPLVDPEKEPDDSPFHITDWMPFRDALEDVAQVVGSGAKAAEELRQGIASGVIEAIDLRIFRWGDRAKYDLPGPEQSGVEVAPLPLSPVHKAHWGRLIRKALANEGRLITPGEEDLEDLADEFVRLQTSDGVTLDEEDFKARADLWGRLIRIARADEYGVLLTPGGQEIFHIRPFHTSAARMWSASGRRSCRASGPGAPRRGENPAPRLTYSASCPRNGPIASASTYGASSPSCSTCGAGNTGTQSSLPCWQRSIAFSRAPRRA